MKSNCRNFAGFELRKFFYCFKGYLQETIKAEDPVLDKNKIKTWKKHKIIQMGYMRLLPGSIPSVFPWKKSLLLKVQQTIFGTSVQPSIKWYIKIRTLFETRKLAPSPSIPTIQVRILLETKNFLNIFPTKRQKQNEKIGTFSKITSVFVYPFHRFKVSQNMCIKPKTSIQKWVSLA